VDLTPGAQLARGNDGADDTVPEIDLTPGLA
jgi:hypothetical protein